MHGHIKQETLKVEIADTPYKQAQGLMFVKDLPYDSGMIFLFQKEAKLQFWGQNTYIPLDIAFIDDNNTIMQISSIQKHSQKLVASHKPCKCALEVNNGFFEQEGITVGDSIDFNKSSGEIIFCKKKKYAQSGFLTENIDKKPIEEDIKIEKPNNDYEVIQWIDAPEDPYSEQQLNQYTLDDILNSIEDNYDDEERPVEEIINEDTGVMQPGEEIEPEVEPMEDTTDELSPEPSIEEIPDRDFPEFSSPMDAAFWGIVNKEGMHIWYTTEHGKSIDREIEPHGLFMAKSTGNIILVTFDDNIGDIRAFIVDKIMHFRFTDKQFMPKFVVK